jgi:hypothetical protein
MLQPRGERHGSIIATAALASLLALPAIGAQRTFVASNGLDANTCSIAAPCRSFATALTHTDAGGEIIVLDSAGYGSVFITQSVSIVAPRGVYAGISVLPSFDGVTVKAAGIEVALRNLVINGQGGNVGINFLQGSRLVIDGCEISGMSGNGIFAAVAGSQLTIVDTVVRRSGANGIVLASGGQVSIVRSRVEHTAVDGIVVQDGSNVSIADSVVSNNVAIGIRVTGTTAAMTKVAMDRLEATGNNTGILVNAPATGLTSVVHVTRSNLSQNSISGLQMCCVGALGTAHASVTDSLIASNGNTGISMFTPASWVLTVGSSRVVDTPGTGLANTGSGTFYTRSDNTLAGNGNGTTGTLTPLGGT